jgi:hypothetical protein
MILLGMMLEVVIGVLVMEFDKVANKVTDMEVDKVADMKNTYWSLEWSDSGDIGVWVKVPSEDFFDETLLIGDTYGDDVRGVDWGAGHWG